MVSSKGEEVPTETSLGLEPPSGEPPGCDSLVVWGLRISGSRQPPCAAMWTDITTRQNNLLSVPAVQGDGFWIENT